MTNHQDRHCPMEISQIERLLVPIRLSIVNDEDFDEIGIFGDDNGRE